MFSVGIFELIAIFVVALLILGPKDLLDLSKTIAKSIGELKNITNEVSKNLDFKLIEDKKKSTNKHNTKDVNEDIKNV